MQIFHIPTTVLLTTFLVFSAELREFCNFHDSIPDDSPYKNLNSMLIYNISGLKPRVKENNPKTLVSEINRQKAFAKVLNNENFNPYAAAYKNMPKFAQANPDIRLDFANGHFGYFYKFGLLTSGWEIPLNIKFFEQEFYESLNMIFETPEDQKYFYMYIFLQI